MGVVILAGGRSERMGRSKANVELHGRPLIELVRGAALEFSDHTVIVGGKGIGWESVPDQFPGEGPLGGLITGLEYLGEGIHIALACDMPLITPAVLRALVSAIGRNEAAVPETGGKLHPLCAAYRGEAVSKLREAFNSGERSLVRVLRWLAVRRVSESELRLVDPALRSLTNINTPADLETLKNG